MIHPPFLSILMWDKCLPVVVFSSPNRESNCRSCRTRADLACIQLIARTVIYVIQFIMVPIYVWCSNETTHPTHYPSYKCYHTIPVIVCERPNHESDCRSCHPSFGLSGTQLSVSTHSYMCFRAISSCSIYILIHNGFNMSMMNKWNYPPPHIIRHINVAIQSHS